MRITAVETALGWIGVAWSERGLVRLELPRETREAALAPLREVWPDALVEPAEALGDVAEELRRYAAGERVDFTARCDLLREPAFRRRVLEVVARIPYGETRSYAWIAREVGRPRAYRAVGQAVAANPIPIIIPCHRVLRSDGGLGGYGGGLALKERLLALEGVGRLPARAGP